MRKTAHDILKNLASCLAVLFALVLLVGCGGQAPESVVTTTEAATSEVAATTEAAEKAAPDVAAPSNSGKLKLDGTQIVSESGTPVQLRGVSTHGLAWFPGYVNQDFFNELRQDWGANVVRLAMYTAESGGYCSDGNKDELMALIDEGVQYATEADLYVIIDWHILSDNNPLTNKDEALAFFKEVSAKYASYNNVIYEICNEPNGGTTWDEIKEYANEVIPVIRENDPNSLIICGTPTWSQDVDIAAQSPLDFDNVLYTLHFYAATHKDDLRNKLSSAIEAGLPIFVSEYGICDASGNGQIDYDSANAWVDLMDSYGVSYCCWNLSNKDEASALFKASCTKTSGFTADDLSDEGLWLVGVLGSTGFSGEALEAAESAAAEAAAANTYTQENAGVTWQVTKANSWEANGETFIQYNMTITNESGSSIDGWSVSIEFNEVPSLSDSWNGTYTVEGNTIRISNVDYNGSIANGASVGDVGFIVSGSSALSFVQ